MTVRPLLQAAELHSSGKSHWDRIYTDKTHDELAWYQQYPVRSLALIDACGVASDTTVIDVGGGASRLMADLLNRGGSGLWLLDISASAMAAARESLGTDAAAVRWVEADIIKAQLPSAHFDIWHDRAVFHFFTEAAERSAYIEKACAAVKPGGHLIIATFAEDGPAQCSGLPVARYDAASMQAEFAGCCDLLHTEREVHRTPAGKLQQFRYFLLRRRAPT